MNEIKPQEIRIGNYIDNYSMPFLAVTGRLLRAFDESKEYCKLYKPIPLTSEWLVKLGFVSDNDKYDPIYKKGHVSLMGSGIINDWILRHDSHGIVNIQYLHQLQNGFYMITGEELIIK